MVSIEALACGTPVIGLTTGATKEIVDDGKTGYIIDENREDLPNEIAKAISNLGSISRVTCRQEFEKRFTLEKMVKAHAQLYEKLATKSQDQL